MQLFVDFARVRGVIAFQEMVQLFESRPQVLIAFPALAHELVNLGGTQVGFGQEHLEKNQYKNIVTYTTTIFQGLSTRMQSHGSLCTYTVIGFTQYSVTSADVCR